jgi:hypothetical protein
VGEDWGADISECYATGHVSGANRVGGLVGKSHGSTISNSYAKGDVNATGGLGYIGGLVGEGIETSIFGCHATGNVIGKGDGVGGLVGFNDGNCTISYCYATGDVSTIGKLQNHVGGLVGNNVNSTISNCYATGNVSGIEENVGGLVGSNSRSSVISYCYATGSVIGSYNVGGLVGLNEWENPAIYNCIAANASVVATTNTNHVNRIAGNTDYDGVCNNNYALNTMIVRSSGLPVTLIDGSQDAGIGKLIYTLQNFAFYDLVYHWDNNAWNIDIETNPNKIWKICDALSLPFFQWQEKSCDFFTISATAGNNGVINPYGEISAVESTDRNFAFLADAGYKVESLLIDGVNKPEFIASGNYTFKDITENHTIHVTFTPNVNINENEQTSNFTVYPNPTKGELRITNCELKITGMELFDVFGRKIMFQQFPEIVIDISHLTAGLYFLKINTEIGQVIKKVLKE